MAEELDRPGQDVDALLDRGIPGRVTKLRASQRQRVRQRRRIVAGSAQQLEGDQKAVLGTGRTRQLHRQMPDDLGSLQRPQHAGTLRPQEKTSKTFP